MLQQIHGISSKNLSVPVCAILVTVGEHMHSRLVTGDMGSRLVTVGEHMHSRPCTASMYSVEPDQAPFARAPANGIYTAAHCLALDSRNRTVVRDQQALADSSSCCFVQACLPGYTAQANAPLDEFTTFGKSTLKFVPRF